MDLRCYSTPQTIPWPAKSLMDLYATIPAGRLKMANEESRLACLLALFNYTGTGDFLAAILGDDGLSSIDGAFEDHRAPRPSGNPCPSVLALLVTLKQAP